MPRCRSLGLTLLWFRFGLSAGRGNGRHASVRVDGFAMLYTGLVLLASLATCTFAYPWLEGYNDNRGRVLPAGVNRASGRNSAGERQPSGGAVPRR